MNVYLYESKSNFKAGLIWLVVLIAIGSVMVSFYPTISKDIDSFIKLIDNFPESMKVAFGMNLDTMGSIIGYYSSFPLIFLTIVGSMQAMIMGVSILSKEARDKTADFLLTKPISRNKIVTSKIMSSLTLLSISNLIIILFMYLLLLALSKISFSFNIYILLSLSILLVQLIFFSLGILMSVVLPKVKSPLSISMGIVFGFYVLSMFGDDKLRLIMPFKYFDSFYILEYAKYETLYLISTLLIVMISITLTYIIYNKKDIHSV